MYQHIQEKQNYCFLDQIIPNSRVSTGNLQLTYINNQTNQAAKQHSLNNSFQSCNKHQQKKGEYFQVEYPWIKYCQNCALNLALCGKKIQKNLSSQQMFTKITLCNVIKKLGQTIKRTQTSHSQYSFLSTQLQRSRQGFISVIHSLDKFINDLAQIKTQLQQKVQIHISNQIKTMFQKQSLLVSRKIELINQKMKIQCGFIQIIDQQNKLSYHQKHCSQYNNQENAQKIIEKCEIMMKQSSELTCGFDYKNELVKKIEEIEGLFDQKILQINQTKLTFMSDKMAQTTITESKYDKLNWSYMNKSLSNIFRNIILPNDSNDLKTQMTLVDLSSIHNEAGKTSHTACQTTLRSSGMVSPAQTSQNCLNQISQNRINSRAVLQLRARCRSKSGSRKIQVNVRQQKLKRFAKLS